MIRRVISGAPKAGKTTLAGSDALHTDDLKNAGWSAASSIASTWFDRPGALEVEGVAASRALRKWLERNPTGKPVDEIVRVETPRSALSPAQRAMAKGEKTVFEEIRPELERRGVRIVKR